MQNNISRALRKAVALFLFLPALIAFAVDGALLPAFAILAGAALAFFFPALVRFVVRNAGELFRAVAIHLLAVLFFVSVFAVNVLPNDSKWLGQLGVAVASVGLVLVPLIGRRGVTS